MLEYEFLENVFDATQELAQDLMGIQLVGVVEANFPRRYIGENTFSTVGIAKQWISGQEPNSPESQFYIVGGDILSV